MLPVWLEFEECQLWLHEIEKRMFFSLSLRFIHLEVKLFTSEVSIVCGNILVFCTISPNGLSGELQSRYIMLLLSYVSLTSYPAV